MPVQVRPGPPAFAREASKAAAPKPAGRRRATVRELRLGDPANSRHDLIAPWYSLEILRKEIAQTPLDRTNIRSLVQINIDRSADIGGHLGLSMSND